MPTEIHRHLEGGISLVTIKRWCQIIRQSDSIQLILGTRASLRIAKALKRISRKAKTGCAQNRRYQFENLRGSSVFLRNKCQTNIKDRFMAQILEKDNHKSSFSDDLKIKRK